MAVTPVRVFAPAKINLTLHITGTRDDGYHLLDSLVSFAFVGDRLGVTPADRTSLEISGPFADKVPIGPDNLVLRAAAAMGLSAAFDLEKSLPVASGIGGGSADAAAALKGLAQVWNRPLPELDVQLALGADVPVCVMGGLVRMRGIGERLEPISDGPVWWPMVLVNPGVPVSTPEVFARLARKDNAPMESPYDLGEAPHHSDDFPKWLARQRNDLEAPAISVAPKIAVVLDALGRQEGCLLARMSGSGATCFGLFGHEDHARAAAERLGADHAKWWVALSEEPGF